MKKLLFLLPAIISVSSLYGVDLSNRNMTMRLNGHDHLVFDPLSYKIEKSYLRNKSSIEDTIETVFKINAGIDTCTAILPENITAITFDNGSTSDTGVIKIKIENCHLQYTIGDCDFDIDFSLLVTGNIFVSTDSLKYFLNMNDLKSTCSNMQVNWIEPDECHFQWWQWLQLWICMASRAVCVLPEMVSSFMIQFGFMNQFVEEIPDKSILIYCLPTKSEVDNYDTSIASDVLNSFPIDFSFTYEGTDSNLVICLDFMKGTDANPTAFTGIQPDPVTHDSYDHIGYGTGFDNFMYAYQASSWGDPDVDSPIECATTLLNLMANTSTQSIKIEVPWLYIQGNIPTNRVNCGLNPDFLDTPAGQDSIDAFMNRSTWQDFDSVLSIILNNGIEPILDIGHGHTRHAPRIGLGKLMAPNNPTGQNDSTYFVDENTYLYYLKLFAHATVKKYHNKVAFWHTENEFNVAKFNRLFYGWRLGNLWDDESSGGFQDKVWDILVNAVRTEDPTAKITTNFHMLNLVKGLQRFGPDCDIIGLNVYPNLKFAYPVLSFVPGELVWATRRALKGLNMSDKDVWITETNYPALYSSDPPANISLDSNIVYYSYGRQANFLESALETSLDYGAKGFFWWSLWLYETATNDDFGDLTDYGGLIPKNSLTLKQPTATQFSTTTLNNHPGKCTVLLTNKNLSTGVNLGGKISLVSERDSLQSGSTVYALRDRSHSSRTDQRVLQGLVHNRWNTEGEYMISESFDIGEDWTSYNRDAFFSSTDNITISTNISLDSVEFWDPWYYNEETETQPDCYRTVSSGSYSVFLNQNVLFDTLKPIYHLKAPKCFATTNAIYDFVRWQSDDPQEAVFNASNATSTDSCETRVLFRMADATVTAVYTAVNQIADYTLEIPFNETLTIPAGANIKFAEGFSIVVEGSFNTLGSKDERVNLDLRDNSEYPWWGITVTPSNSTNMTDVTLAYCNIENCYNGIEVNENQCDAEINLNHCVISQLAEEEGYEDWTGYIVKYDGDVNSLSTNNRGKVYINVENCTFIGGKFLHQNESSLLSSFRYQFRSNIFYGCQIITDEPQQFWGNDFYNCTYDSDESGGGEWVYQILCYQGNDPYGDTWNYFVNPTFLDFTNADFQITRSSPCIDKGCSFSPKDPDSTRTDIGAYYYPQMTASGTISADTTWYGKVTVTGDVIVTSGAELTIDPGSEIAFNSGKKINVYGALNAQGTSDCPIVFTSSSTSPTAGIWSGIYFQNSSVDASCILKYCEIKYAQYGVYAYYANPTIHSCWIHNNVYGIFGGTSSMTVTNNKIYDNTLDGGYFGGGTPKFYSNSIYDNTGNGLYFYASSGKIGYSSGTTSGLNEISANGSWGIYASESTEIFMGSSDSEGNRIGGYNAVMGNTTNEVCSNSSHVEAEYNYWGTSSPTSALFTLVYGGTIDYVPYRTSDPNGGSNLAKRSAITGNDVAENKTNRWAGYDPNNLDLNKLSDLWLYGLDLSLSKKPEKAIEIYQRLIEKFPESVEAKKAMAKIHHLLRECSDKSQENYFVTLLQKEKGCKTEYKNTALSLAGYTYCDMGLPLEAVNIFKRVVDEYPDSSCSLGALYNLVVLNLKEIKDNSSASTYLEIMKKKYPSEALTLFARTEMGEEVDWSVLSKKTTPQPKDAAEKLPTEFMLHNNYPNPFNPVTNIKFDLPEDAHVTITVYDINGREVVRLIDRDMNAGYQNIIWNAKDKFGHDMASGFYICQMRTSTGFVKTNKMILMR